MGVSVKREYRIEDGSVIFDFTYNKEIVDTIKEIDFKHRTYNTITKEWTIIYFSKTETQIENIIEIFNFLYKKPIKINSNSIDKENIYKNKKAEIKLEKTYRNEACNLSPIIKPFEFQYHGIDIMCNLDHVINGDDMGTGKSIQTIYSTEIMNRFPMLLICPSNVKYQWKDLWNKVKPERNIYIYETEDKIKNWNADVIIISFGVLGEKEYYINKNGEEKHRVVNKIDELLQIPFKYCCIDEIHSIKNSSAVRSKAVHMLTKNIPAVHGLTGTLIDNKPRELVNPLIVIKKFNELFGNWNKFIYKFCGAKKTRFSIDSSGATNIMELNYILRSSCYFRREKRDVLKDLPEIQYSVLNIELSNKKTYLKAENDFIEYIKENFSKIKQEKAINAEYLVMKNELKKLSIEGKLKGIIAYLKELQENTTEKILVVGLRTEPLEKLAKEFKSSLLNGSLSAEQKRDEINKWNENDIQFIFGNMLAIGTGTDGLQKNCNTIVILEYPDKPSILDQTVSRIERIGVKNAINVYSLLCKSTIDMAQWEMIQRKKIITEAANKGKDYKSIDIDDVIMDCYLKRL